MEIGLAVLSNPSPALRCNTRILVSPRQRQLALRRYSLFSASHTQRLLLTSVKVSASEDSSDPNVAANYLNKFLVRLQEGYPRQMKDFPWNRAMHLAAERMLNLGKKYLKWSIVALLALGFISDAIFAISRNKELLVPLGLFIGVTLADFLKEFSLDIFNKTTKDQDYGRHIALIGILFMILKVVAALPCGLQLQVLLSHMSNGGLLQVLWIAKNIQQTE